MPDYDVQTLDLHYQGLKGAIAAYLLRGPQGAALIETGPGSSLPGLLQELARFGLAPGDIKDVLVTHIHLDHSGAAGWWAQQGARVHVHPLGAPHLADPSKLLASAQRIYGAEMDRLWGQVIPVPADRLRTPAAGEIIRVAGLEITALDSPGHAKHHYVYQLGTAAFTGDIAGVMTADRAYRQANTPPPEFDLEAWLATIKTLRARSFTRLYLTHFASVDDVDTHWAALETALGDLAARVRESMAQGLDRDAILVQLEDLENGRMAAAGVSPSLIQAFRVGTGPVAMTVDGIMRYWTKRNQANPKA